MPKIRTVFLSLTIALSSATTHAADLWGPQGFTGFTSGLQTASQDVLRETAKSYCATLQQRTDLDLSRVRVATFRDIDPILRRATQHGWGTLDLFTQKELADKTAVALLLDERTLRQIDEKYDLNGAWLISARTLLTDHRPISMDYLIVGQGKLIIGYPYESAVEVIEEGKPLDYRYEPFIEASIVNDQARRGLFDLKALNSPTGEFLSFEGPMGASVKSFQLEDRSILVNYTLGIDQESQAAKTPIVLKRTSVASQADP